MAYINKNANLVLLFLIVISVAFLVGATVFYQSAMGRVNDRYNDKVLRLKDIEKELDVKVKLLEKVKRDLELKAAREESFSQKFSDIRNQNEALEKDKLGLEGAKSSLEKQLSDIQTQISSLQADLSYERAKIAQLQQDISDLKHEIDDAEEDVDYYRNQCRALGGCQ